MNMPPGYDDAKQYEDAVIMAAGQALARKLPKFYGKITLNLQGAVFRSGVMIDDSDHIKVERSIR